MYSPEDINADLEQSIKDEEKAISDYVDRASGAKYGGDSETEALYRHIIKEENEHAQEFRKRLREREENICQIVDNNFVTGIKQSLNSMKEDFPADTNAINNLIENVDRLHEYCKGKTEYTGQILIDLADKYNIPNSKLDILRERIEGLDFKDADAVAQEILAEPQDWTQVNPEFFIDFIEEEDNG